MSYYCETDGECPWNDNPVALATVSLAARLYYLEF